MEKLEPFLNGLKKYHFWILCGLVVLTVVYGWYAAYGELPVTFQKNKVQVAQAFAKVNGIASREAAGPSWADDAKKKSRELKGVITTVVEQLQTFQSPEKPWPKDLSKEFRAAVQRQGRTGTWTQELLAEYQKIAPEEVEGLRTLVGAAKNADSPGVQWDKDGESYKQFREQFVFSVAPAPIAIFDSQEKLWAAAAVLRAIADTNAPAKDPFNLPISAIEVFEVGPLALRNRTIHMVEVATPPPPVPGTPPAPAPAPAGLRAAAKPGAASKKAPPVAAPPPPAPALPASAVAPKPIPGLRACPVRLRLQMDPMVLSRLLVALANQRLTIIVDDVHFENALTLVRREPPPQPKAAAKAGPAPPAGPGAAAPKKEAAPVVDAGPPQLIQVPRGTVVEILATVYIADAGGLEEVKIADAGGIRR